MPFDFDIFKKSPELAHLESLLDAQDATIRKAFLDFVARVSSEDVIKAIADLVARGAISDALAIIDYQGATLGTATNSIFVGSARQEAEQLMATLRRLAPANPLAFNPFEPVMATLANQTGLAFIRDTTETQKDAILAALSGNIGDDVRVTARIIRSSIGLTAKQIDTVNRYRSLLESGSKQALDFALRDKRFDSSAAKASDVPLTAEKIDRMVDRYRQNYIGHRATVIARTEGGAISGIAREAGVRQMLQQANISEDRVDKTWRTRRDSLVRDLHQDMSGETVRLNERFQMSNGETCMRPLDPSLSAKQRCQCRCVATYRVRR